MICRIVVPETPKFFEGLAHLDYHTRELVAYVESTGDRQFPITGAIAKEVQSQLRWLSQPLIKC